LFTVVFGKGVVLPLETNKYSLWPTVTSQQCM